ncbi:acyl carrier protein [Plantactinospora siamensis]|uniref:Acyl carrier protein n=1 Tax=Plantactinospora siamensis TaxID=555372 RepID=A0ABV6P4G4_9ACTN
MRQPSQWARDPTDDENGGEDSMSIDANSSDPEVRARVRSIVLQVAPNSDGVKAGPTHLVDDLEYHSLALLELGFALEDEFDLPPLDQAQVQHITTVEEIEDLVLELLRQGADRGSAEK